MYAIMAVAISGPLDSCLTKHFLQNLLSEVVRCQTRNSRCLKKKNENPEGRWGLQFWNLEGMGVEHFGIYKSKGGLKCLCWPW